MTCCVCNGSCCHVGAHSYCAAHGGTSYLSWPSVRSASHTSTNSGVSVDMLAAALGGLLEDTQRAAHDCGDADCPVEFARSVLAAYRSTQITWSVSA